MSLKSWNDGADVAWYRGEPDPKRMANDHDYFEGFCFHDAINQRYDEEQKYMKEYDALLDREYQKMLNEGNADGA